MGSTAEHDRRYRAIAARDTRFDGQFVTAVRSTRIYCRPSCPARTPKPENVTFYSTSAAAHEAGYRACKRCLPEAAPGSPAWDLRGDAAANVIKELLDSGAMPDKVSGLVEQDIKTAFYAGDVGFMNGVDNQLAEIEEAGLNAKFVPSLMGEQLGTFVASDALVMLDKCPDKQLCTDLVQFMLAGDQMSTFHKEIVDYPPVGSDETVVSDNPFFPVYVEQADMLRSLPIAAGGAEVYNTLYENLQQMVLGQKTPEQALADAAEAGDAALKNN